MILGEVKEWKNGKSYIMKNSINFTPHPDLSDGYDGWNSCGAWRELEMFRSSLMVHFMERYHAGEVYIERMVTLATQCGVTSLLAMCSAIFICL